MEKGDEMIKLAVIADDLTGANDTALQFAKRNIRASVKMDLTHGMGEDMEAEGVVVADSDSRDLDAAAAYEKVHMICSRMRELRPQSVFKKIDSTLRGNIGAEIRAAADVFAPDLVIIAPAYPRIRRTTLGGHHLMDGVPLDLTEIAHAPKTPVRESYIPSILARQASDIPIGVLDYQTVRTGAAEIAAELRRLRGKGIRWIVSDIVEERNFADLMEALRDECSILWVGSAGLADHLPAFYGWTGTASHETARRAGAVIVCAGSVSHTTQAQVRRLKETADVAELRIDVERALTDADASAHYAHMLGDLLHTGRDTLITSAQTDAEVRQAVAAGKAYGLSGKEVSERIAQLFADVLGRTNLNEVAGLVLTGGDTAVHICRALGVHSIDILREIEPGVPLGILRGQGAASVFVVTKAGAFGEVETFVRAVHTIRNL